MTDPVGRSVTGLQRENFQLWEDKLEQKLEYFSGEDTPVSIGLIFDATGSMADKIKNPREHSLEASVKSAAKPKKVTKLPVRSRTRE